MFQATSHRMHENRAPPPPFGPLKATDARLEVKFQASHQGFCTVGWGSGMCEPSKADSQRAHLPTRLESAINRRGIPGFPHQRCPSCPSGNPPQRAPASRSLAAVWSRLLLVRNARIRGISPSWDMHPQVPRAGLEPVARLIEQDGYVPAFGP